MEVAERPKLAGRATLLGCVWKSVGWAIGKLNVKRD